MSIARHAAIAAVIGTVAGAVAVVLLSSGPAGAGTAGPRAGTSEAHRPGPDPSTTRAAPVAAPPATPRPVAAAPQVRPGDPRLGPYEALAGCLRAGNTGMGDGSWEDYECVGGAGAWRVQPTP